MLAAFVAHPNRVLSRDLLVDLLRGYDRDPFDRSIDNRVTRLRRNIEVDACAPAYIRTVRGEGYQFTPQGGSPCASPSSLHGKPPGCWLRPLS